jgi:tRNA(Met) cytidine acetyltransferase
MHMLDDEAVSIHVTQADQKIIAVALLIKEGGIDAKTATDIYEGTRRLQGHLVAQSLAANVGIESAPCLIGERVIRIAVHPNLQQQSFGTALLTSLKEQSQADYLSTSFGATTELLAFWQQLSFTPVYLGMKRDASSGTHSVVMLHAKNSAGQNLLDDAQQDFAKCLPHLLSEPFRNIEADLALALLSPKKSSRDDIKQLAAFAEKQRGYENTFRPIWKLVCDELSQASTLRREEKEILVLKVLQKHTWQFVSKKMGATIQGKKDALRLLRQAVSKLLSG